MIEINLIPDVKLELLKARRVRTNVISLSILTTIVAAGVVVVMGLYVFVGQTVAESLADAAIKKESQRLEEVDDLSKILTIQNQLSNIADLHDEKRLSSRIFDVIDATVPTGANAITISRLSLDGETNTISIEGEAKNGYKAFEVFKKTISETTFAFVQDNSVKKPIDIAESIAEGEQRLGDDTDGSRVLRFTLSFVYPDELFSPLSRQGRVIGPERQNVTDSSRGVPKSLFTVPTVSGGDQ